MMMIFSFTDNLTEYHKLSSLIKCSTSSKQWLFDNSLLENLNIVPKEEFLKLGSTLVLNSRASKTLILSLCNIVRATLENLLETASSS